MDREWPAGGIDSTHFRVLGAVGSTLTQGSSLLATLSDDIPLGSWGELLSLPRAFRKIILQRLDQVEPLAMIDAFETVIVRAHFQRSLNIIGLV